MANKFEFGDHIAVGTRFGPNNRYDIGLRLQHLSNAGIDHPNPGINLILLRFQYRM